MSVFLKITTEFLNTIAKLVEKAHKIEEGETYNVNVQQMSSIIHQLVMDIDQVCGDCPRRMDLARKIGDVGLVTEYHDAIVGELPTPLLVPRYEADQWGVRRSHETHFLRQEARERGRADPIVVVDVEEAAAVGIGVVQAGAVSDETETVLLDHSDGQR